MRLTDNTYIKESPIYEWRKWGVFADKDIKAGDVIMECVIPNEMLTKNTLTMRSYRFAWRGDEYNEDFIPLGSAALCNLSDKNHVPNFDWELDKANKILRARAITDIEKDREILWNGTGDFPLKPEEIS